MMSEHELSWVSFTVVQEKLSQGAKTEKLSIFCKLGTSEKKMLIVEDMLARKFTTCTMRFSAFHLLVVYYDISRLMNCCQLAEY